MSNVQINGDIAIAWSDEVIIKDAQSTLDFIATIGHDYEVCKVAINKSAITEDFFKLSTGIAGEVVQKFVNYHFKLAIIGDFSTYASKPLQDYIYECNNGRELYFVSDVETAIEKLKN